MACEIVTTKGAVFSVWGKPTQRDMDRVLEALRSAKAQAGAPVVYITRVPTDAPPPDPEVRRYLNKLMPQVFECCSTYHVVLEGAGFVAAMKRAVLVTLFQLGGRRGTFFVHSLPAEVIDSVKREVRSHVTDLLQSVGAKGLLITPPPVSVPPPGQPRRAA
jgi:hypothetical protein